MNCQILILCAVVSLGSLLAAEQEDFVVKHEHHHVHETKNGPTFDDMLQSARANMLPGAVAGAVEGVVLGGILTGLHDGEAENFEYPAASLPNVMSTDIIEGLAANFVTQWREHEDEFTQRQAGTSSYLSEKTMQNMAKFLAALVMINSFEENHKNEKKAILIERFANTMMRDQKIINGRYSKGLWRFILRTLSESVYAYTGESKPKVCFDIQRGLVSATGVLAGELAMQMPFTKRMSKNMHKRVERVVTAVASGLGKVVYGETAKKDGIIIENHWSLESKNAVGVAIVSTFLAWISQHENGKWFLHECIDTAKRFIPRS